MCTNSGGSLHNDKQHDDSPHPHNHSRTRGPISAILHFINPGHSHDATDKIDTALETSAKGKRALKISLIGLSVTALLQVVIVVMSGSVALLSDTIHNFADALTAIPLWIAFSLGTRARNRRYTYGYGRAEDLAGIFIVLVIAASAGIAAYESIKRLADPQPLNNLGLVFAASIIGFLGNELVAIYRIRVGREIGSAALVADGLHARTDGLTSLAVFAGALGAALGFPQADPIAGLLITVAILTILTNTAKDVYHRLMDAVAPELVSSIETCAKAVKGVESVDDVRVRWIGHRLRAEIEVKIDGGLSVAEGHDIAVEIHHALLHGVPKLDSAIVHTNPSLHDSSDPHAALAHHISDETTAPAS